MSQDFYKILGVSKDASNEEIKKAYKNLAKKYHPDVSSEKNAESLFKEVQQAYAILGDKQKRANYDQFGSEHGPNFSGFGSGFSGGAGFDFSDIFENFGGSPFGDMFGFRDARPPRENMDITATLELTIEEAVFGTEKKFSYNIRKLCKKCSGKGYEKEKDVVTCTHCNGHGIRETLNKTILGTFKTQSTCQACEGTGKEIKKKCSQCNATGYNPDKKIITLKIPRGIDTGFTLKAEGKGHEGKRGDIGHLYAKIFVAPHEIFKRDGRDIFIKRKIDFVTATIGGEIKVPTLHGTVKMKVPPATQNNSIFKLRGKGAYSLRVQGLGNQFVEIDVMVPKNLSKKQKDLLKEFKKTLGDEDEQGFFDKLKNKFKN